MTTGFPLSREALPGNNNNDLALPTLLRVTIERQRILENAFPRGSHPLPTSADLGEFEARNESGVVAKNLDVLGTSGDLSFGFSKGAAGELAPEPLLCSLDAHTAQPQPDCQQRQYRAGGTKYITIPQATSIIEAVEFARSINLPLVAHLTIYWGGTDAGDDPEGKLFAAVREGLSKWLHRKAIEFTGAWARERPADVEHCHLLFHLPVNYCNGAKLLQVEAATNRLVALHGRGVWGDGAIKLVIWPSPDGKYLLKGGGPKVWKLFRLRKEHRRLQGIIHGKRCGTTENIGPAARQRLLRSDAKNKGAGQC